MRRARARLRGSGAGRRGPASDRAGVWGKAPSEMDISLSKLPWQAQIGAFVALAVAGIGAFIYYYEMPMRDDIGQRRGQLTSLKADIDKGQATARKLPEF